MLNPASRHGKPDRPAGWHGPRGLGTAACFMRTGIWVADRIPGSLPLTDILLPRAICADARN
ncbi:predicted protein [Brucella abortus]|uniref:Uncharacterized protein n=1 Tax=Brucella abortus (strain 2308) TaxID=359391 RepID=Q2YR48_BRUA2|nr:conserved hypothetical protein [Brucella abortus 2308]SHO31772.1 predicted protein [Brucella abortus]